MVPQLKLLEVQPVALEDGLSREHGSSSGGLGEAAQLGGGNEGPGQAGLQGEGHHLAPQGGDAAVNVQGV